jgi:competence protein ComEC
MEFLQRTPFLRLLLPFILGIILYQYMEFLHGVLYGLFCISFVLFLLSYGFHTPKRQFQFRWLFGSGVFVFMLSLAYFLCVENEKSSIFDQLNQKGIYRIEIISAPVEKAKSYQCTVNVSGFFDNSWKSARGNAIVYIQKDKAASKVLSGDRLMVEARFTTPEKAMNPDGFDYAAYLHRQGIGATCYIPSGKWQLTDRNNSFSIRRTSDKCRNYLLDVYRKFHIQGDEFAVLAALTLGYTNDLQPDLRAGYAAAGVMHILALSGLHIGIVYVVFAFLLGFLNKTNRQKVIKSLIIMLFLWAFAFLTGLSASVIRATLMFSFVTVATCFERKSQIYNTIFMSMLVMLLFNPNYLYNVGYQLSYAAVLSIIFFKPVLDKIYNPTNRYLRFAWSTFSVSLAAQIGTTPFTLYYFQQFPNYFLITNIIAIPIATIVIYLAMGLLFSSFVPYLPDCIGFLLNRTVWLLNYVMSSIQNLPYSVSHISLDIRQSFVLFLAIFCFSAYYFNKKVAPLMIGLASVLLTCIFNIQVNYQTLTTKRMIVYAGMRNTHVSFINGTKNHVFTTDSLEIKRIAKTFWQNQKLDTPVYLHKNDWFNDGFACFEDSKILILTQDYLNKQNSKTPLELDYLVIGNRLKPRMEQILQCVHPREIIIDNSISKWYTENIKQICICRKIKYYSVAEKGAYIQYIKD